jgi:hypothetical protein
MTRIRTRSIMGRNRVKTRAMSYKTSLDNAYDESSQRIEETVEDMEIAQKGIFDTIVQHIVGRHDKNRNNQLDPEEYADAMVHTQKIILELRTASE